MLINYLKTAIRNVKKTRLFSLINVSGLAIGMTACLLILFYVSYEKSYDRFHEDHERVYRLRYERASEEGTSVRFASCCPPAAPLIRDTYPEVEKIARIFRYRAGVSFGENKFMEERMYFAEPDFLNILKFRFITGDPLTGITEPNQAFISQTTARKYFGDRDPLGKVLSVDKKVDYRIAGVFADTPANSHINFDILLSYKNLESLYGPDVLSSWGHTGFFTYLRLKPDSSPKAFEDKLMSLVESACGDLMKTYKVLIQLKMQSIGDIHLDSHFMQEYQVNGDRNAVNFLFIIALFIILMAWVNYINLSTARSLTRAREVGLRKVVGAGRGQLMVQFFFEALLLNLGAVCLTLMLVNWFLPLFRNITGTPELVSIWQENWFWPALVFLYFAGVFLSGLYPVLMLSSFKPTTVLKGKLGGAARGISLRKVLVVFQFLTALVLIAGTLTVYRQIHFMKNRDTGFNMNQILVVKAPRVRDQAFDQKFPTFKESLLSNAAIKKMSVVTEVPGRQILWDAGAIRRAGEDMNKGKNYQIVGVDYDFLDVFDLKPVFGRNFSRDFPADKNALLLNETAVRWMGFENSESAIGQPVDYWGEIFTIIGVLSDYHQQSPKMAFEPHIYRFLPFGRGVRGQFALKITPGNTQEIIALVKRQYDQFFPGNPFEYFFLDDYYTQQYRGDELFGQVFTVFAFLSIFVTGLGIFGLSSFYALQRTREIAVRKVLGAGVGRIALLLTRDIGMLIAIAGFLALPLEYLGVKWWLNSFATRMEIDFWLFLIPLLGLTLITMLITLTHVVKTALTNPAQALKYE